MVYIGYKLKYKKLSAFHLVGEVTEQEAQNFYDNIPSFFEKLKLQHDGLTGAMFLVGEKWYGYGSCIGIKKYGNIIPYIKPVEKEHSDIADCSTEELIMELINRGYAVSKIIKED